jgi:peptidoglycan/xylan/chitin deacetylase (PgdA/CDA1 family)
MVTGRVRRRRLRRLSVGAAAAAHLAPSALVLSQWWPDGIPDPRAIPGVCRWRGPPNGRGEVALTFDDGPDPAGTVKVLDSLDRVRLRATFFCLGAQAESHPALVEEIAGRGHEIGVHGHRHCRHLLHTARYIARDLERCLDTMSGLDVRPAFFRPPYGQVAGGSLVAARRSGLELVLWSAWGREWSDEDAASVTRRVERRLGPGSIVLLHDSGASAKAGTAARAADVVARLSETLAARRLSAVTMSELVRP